MRCLTILFLTLLFTGNLQGERMDLSLIPCEAPWELFTTESNTIGIFFEEPNSTHPPRTLFLSDLPPENMTVEFGFTLRSLKPSSLSTSFGIQIWDGLESHGKKERPGHFLIFFTSEGNLECLLWNGLYYSTVKRRSRFSLRSAKPQVMKIDIMKNGSLRVYINNRLQLSVRTKLRLKGSYPLRLCATPGTYAEVAFVDIRPFGISP